MSEPSRKLSTEEVSALMDGLKTGDLSSSTIKDSKDVEVKVFSFGSDDLTLLGDYYALRLINERFARQVRTVFLPLLLIWAKSLTLLNNEFEILGVPLLLLAIS